MYYNTMGLSARQVRIYKEMASNQDKLLLAQFQNEPDRGFAAYEIRNRLENKYPIQSIVRSINTLTNLQLIEKCNLKVQGEWGRQVGTWILKRATSEASQLNIL